MHRNLTSPRKLLLALVLLAAASCSSAGEPDGAVATTEAEQAVATTPPTTLVEIASDRKANDEPDSEADNEEVAAWPRLNDGSGCDDGFGTIDGLAEYATVGDTMQRLDLVTGEVSDHGTPPVECALWLGDEEAGRRFAISPDGDRLWVGAFDGAWDIEVELAPGSQVMSRTIAGDRVVLVDSEGAEATIYDTASGAVIGSPFPGNFSGGRNFSATATHPNASTIAIGAASESGPEGGGRVLIVDAASGTLTADVETPSGMTSLAFDQDTSELIGLGADGSVITIELETGNIVSTVQSGSDSAFFSAMGIRSDGLLVVVSQNQAEVIDRRSGPTGATLDLRGVAGARVRVDGSFVKIRHDSIAEIYNQLAVG